MKKLLVSASAFALLAVGYNSPAYAAKNPNDKDCGNFNSKQEVMEFWYSNGYNANNDPHDLDRDNDGLPCEVNKGDYDQFVASKQESTNKQEPAQEPVKQENQQESTKQENNQTVTQQEQTKTETTTTNKQGEKLPNTASNGLTMMLASASLALVGAVLMFRRKKTNA